MASITTSAPFPPVSARIPSTGSVSRELITCVAPNCLAHSSFRGSMSTAMIVRAPLSTAPSTAASPTPPQPMTATESPRVTGAVLMAAPRPAMTPQPSRPATSGRAAGLTLVHWPGRDQGLLRERADPQRGGQDRAVGQGHLLAGVVRVEAVPGPAPLAGAALAADRAPVQDDEVAGRDRGDPVADRLDHAGRLVPEQVGVVVPDAAFPVVQVGVADAAGLHPDQGLARPRIGHHDRGELNFGALSWGDDAPDFVCHPTIVPNRGGQRKAGAGLQAGLRHPSADRCFAPPGRPSCECRTALHAGPRPDQARQGNR